jgi:hypothetical protein
MIRAWYVVGAHRLFVDINTNIITAVFSFILKVSTLEEF